MVVASAEPNQAVQDSQTPKDTKHILKNASVYSKSTEVERYAMPVSYW